MSNNKGVPQSQSKLGDVRLFKTVIIRIIVGNSYMIDKTLGSLSPLMQMLWEILTNWHQRKDHTHFLTGQFNVVIQFYY